MNRTLAPLSIAIFLVGCGEKTPGNSECLGLGVENPAYPGTHEISAAAVAQFQQDAELFRQAYREEGVDVDAYDIMPRAATVTPYIEWNFADQQPGILVTDEELSIDNAQEVLSAFYDRWSEFFNPYGVELVRGDISPDPGYAAGADCEEHYCRVHYAQQLCGIPISLKGPHEYHGAIEIMAFTILPPFAASPQVPTASLASVQSGLVPQVPLPGADAPSAEQAMQIIDGLEVMQSCTGQETLGSQSCVRSVDGPYVLVTATGETGTSTTIEYRIVVEAEVEPTCGEGDEFSHVVVTIDAVEDVVLSSRDKSGCDS